MKKIVILKTTGGELSNQLWNYSSIYAYTLDRKLKLENYSFFEYGNYFTIPTPNTLLRFFFFAPFTNYTKRKNSFKRKLWRKVYEYFVKLVTSGHKDAIITSDNSKNKPFYLPPTSEDDVLLTKEAVLSTIYFNGWLFRNPVGIERYRKEILEYFRPRQDIEDKVLRTIKILRDEFKHIIGVHIRQGDYLTWRGGAYFVSQTRGREILDKYVKTMGIDVSETCFVITSDGPINTPLFIGLHTLISKEDAVHDLFLLSATDTIIGSNSTFGAFASYYGNIPLIVMQKNEIDWEYYLDKRSYFENKYCTMVHY